MNCETFPLLISREIDGQISPEDAALLMAHTNACASCRDERESHRRLHAALTGMPRPVAPDGLAERIADRVLAAPKAIPFARRALPFARSAAILLAVAAIGWFAGQRYDRGVEAGPLKAMEQLSDFRKDLVQSEPLLVAKFGITPELARRIGDIRLRYKMEDLRIVEPTTTGSLDDRWDRESAEILQSLPAEARERYREYYGMTREDLERLLALPIGR